MCVSLVEETSIQDTFSLLVVTVIRIGRKKPELTIYRLMMMVSKVKTVRNEGRKE